jgi:hypothetical protein
MIFTLPTQQPRVTQGPMLYLDQFFDDRTLLLLDEDTDCVDWHKQYTAINQFVIDNNISTVVIHGAINPVNINTSHNSQIPSLIEMQRQLSNVATTYLLTGDFYYHYNSTPGIVFFPTFLWLNSAKLMGKYFKERANTVYDIEFVEKTKTLMCLNANTPWHRIYLFSLLAGRSWFNDIGYSFHARTGHAPGLSFESRLDEFGITQHMTQSERDLARSYASMLPIALPEDSITDKRKSSVHSWIYQSYAINLVTETSLSEGVMLTEKISKAFTAYQIPILIAPPGSSQFLQDLGIDMFGDYIPWNTWDHIADHKLRITTIVEFLDHLLSSDNAEQDILLAHLSFKSRLIKNQEYFHSKEFENLLLKSIRSCTS